MVIAIVVARHGGEVPSPAVTAFAFGFAGVDIFFVLSGFLITSLLIGEWSRRKRISLRQFYVRRALRLLPALFAFLIDLLLFVHFQPEGSRRALLEAAGLSSRRASRSARPDGGREHTGAIRRYFFSNARSTAAIGTKRAMPPEPRL